MEEEERLTSSYAIIGDDYTVKIEVNSFHYGKEIFAEESACSDMINCISTKDPEKEGEFISSLYFRAKEQLEKMKKENYKEFTDKKFTGKKVKVKRINWLRRLIWN